MIDFSHLKKFIYFPRAHERRPDPFVIYALDKWGREWRGNVNAAELLERKFQFYVDVRCQPYSEELWAACREWSERRRKLAEDFESLRLKGVKQSGSQDSVSL